MQGSKSCQPRIFYQVSLEQLVPDDHLVRGFFEQIFTYVLQVCRQAGPPVGETSLKAGLVNGRGYAKLSNCVC
ncbi:MAG: hypothetical protein ABSH16_02215 [Sedimentisphaerales bacterium]